MKRIFAMVLTVAALLSIAGCKPKANENIAFTAVVTSIEEDGILMETTDDVGFTEVLVHLAENYTPSFAVGVGQTVKATILPMVTRSLPPQATAVKIELVAEAESGNAATVTDGLDPMPMLTAGPDANATEADTPENQIANLLPIMDAILHTTGIADERAYMPSDPYYRWAVMQYMGEHWAHTSTQTEAGESGVTVPADTLMQWAAAAFGNVGDMPAVPESMNEGVPYDADKRVYTFVQRTPVNDEVTAIDKLEANGDGTYTVTVGLYQSSGERKGGVVFTVSPNPATDGAYRYFVTAAEGEKQ